MKRTFTQEEKGYVFNTWKQGKGFSEIGKALGAKPGSIFTILREHGGIQPKPRKRAEHHLTLEEREEIRAGLSAKNSFREIAYTLNRAPSTVSREVNKNGGRRWYKAHRAEKKAWLQAKRPKTNRLQDNPMLKEIVVEKLEMKWSPEQISEWLKVEYCKRNEMQISHESIYKSLYIRSRKTLEPVLMNHLRRAHKMRQGKKHSRRGDRGTINILKGVSIHKRPREIDKRKTVGHWEGDLVSGSNNSHIATLVDRKSRLTFILKLSGKDADSVNAALVEKFSNLPFFLKKSLTWDRGMELAKHLILTEETGVPVYFCDPQSPWQRGTNENTNSLIRQYFPKKTCLRRYSQKELDFVADQLNNRPRKILKFKTPNEIIEKYVALTG